MGSTQIHHDPSYVSEVWSLFGIGFAVILCRLLVRIRSVGLRRLAGDDYVSFFLLGLYAVDAVTVTLPYYEGTNIDYPRAKSAQLTYEEVRTVEHGSRMQFLAWYTYTGMLWGLKACMLFFLNRLTAGLPQQRFVKALAVICCASYIAMFVTISASCHPIQWNWKNFFVCTTLNVLTDAALLCIPLPLVWSLRVSLRKKIVLTLMLCSGLLVIAAAILRIDKTLTSKPSSLTMNIWGVREIFVAVLAVNAPLLRPLFTKAFYSKDYMLPTTRSSTSMTQRTSIGSSRLMSSLSLRKPEATEMISWEDIICPELATQRQSVLERFNNGDAIYTDRKSASFSVTGTQHTRTDSRSFSRDLEKGLDSEVPLAKVESRDSHRTGTGTRSSTPDWPLPTVPRWSERAHHRLHRISRHASTWRESLTAHLADISRRGA